MLWDSARKRVEHDRSTSAQWISDDPEVWEVLSVSPEKSTQGFEHLWKSRLPYVSGGVASVIRHKRQCNSRDQADNAYCPAITQGEVEFTFTCLSGTGTCMRVGVAAADNSSETVGIKLVNGDMAIEPRGRDWRNREPIQNLKIDNEGGGKPLVKHNITCRVNMAMRVVSFCVDNGMPIEPLGDIPKCGVRPWVQMFYKGDCVAISSFRRTGCDSQGRPLWRCPSPKRSPSPNGQWQDRLASPKRSDSRYASPRSPSPSPSPSSGHVLFGETLKKTTLKRSPASRSPHPGGTLGGNLGGTRGGSDLQPLSPNGAVILDPAPPSLPLSPRPMLNTALNGRTLPTPAPPAPSSGPMRSEQHGDDERAPREDDDEARIASAPATARTASAPANPAASVPATAPREPRPPLSKTAQVMMERLRLELSAPEHLRVLGERFASWDADGSGALSEPEFREAMAHTVFPRLMAGRLPETPAEAKALLEALIKEDEEFEGYEEVHGSYSAFVAACTFVFDEFDADGGGTIATTEFMAVAVRDAIARKGDRLIDLFRKLADGQEKARRDKERIAAARDKDMFDTSYERFGKDYVPPPPGIMREDFHKGVKMAGVDARAEDVDALFDLWDGDRSGRIELDEFQKHLKQDGAAVNCLRKAMRDQKASSGKKH